MRFSFSVFQSGSPSRSSGGAVACEPGAFDAGQRKAHRRAPFQGAPRSGGGCRKTYIFPVIARSAATWRSLRKDCHVASLLAMTCVLCQNCRIDTTPRLASLGTPLTGGTSLVPPFRGLPTKEAGGCIKTDIFPMVPLSSKRTPSTLSFSPKQQPLPESGRGCRLSCLAMGDGQNRVERELLSAACAAPAGADRRRMP